MSECSGPGCKHSSHKMVSGGYGFGKTARAEEIKGFDFPLMDHQLLMGEDGGTPFVDNRVGVDYLKFWIGDFCVTPPPPGPLDVSLLALVARKKHEEEMRKISCGERPSILDQVAECGCHRYGYFYPDWNRKRTSSRGWGSIPTSAPRPTGSSGGIGSSCRESKNTRAEPRHPPGR